MPRIRSAGLILGWKGCVPNVVRGNKGQPLSARIRIDSTKMVAGSATSRSSRNFARSLGKADDAAGHILGQNLGGNGGIKNVFPQNPHINRGRFRDFEKSVKTQMKKDLGIYDLEWKFEYGNGGTRPTSIEYNVYKDGVKVLEDVFKN